MGSVNRNSQVSTRAADLQGTSAQTVNLNQLLQIKPRKLPTSDQLPRISTPKKPSQPPSGLSVTAKPNRTVAGGNTATLTYNDTRSGVQATGTLSQSAARPGDRVTQSGNVSVQGPVLGGTGKITGTYDPATNRINTNIGVDFGTDGSAGVSLPAGKPVTITGKTPALTVGNTPITVNGAYTPNTGANTVGVNVGTTGLSVSSQPGKPSSIGVTAQLGTINGTAINGAVNYTPNTGEWRVEVKPFEINF
jgi:hypothetical protein